MLPAVPVRPPTCPSSLVHWANLLLPLRTRLPSLCLLTSRGRRPAGGVRRPVPRSQARPPPEVHAEPPPPRLRDEPRLLWGCAPRGPPVPIRPRPDGTRYRPPLPRPTPTPSSLANAFLPRALHKSTSSPRALPLAVPHPASRRSRRPKIAWQGAGCGMGLRAPPPPRGGAPE